MDDAKLELDCAIQVTPGKSVEVAYQVINGTAEDIFVFTPVVKAPDVQRELLDKEKAYTFLDEEGYLHITKRVWPMPEEIDVYEAELPRVTAVPAGCFYEERFSLKMPVGIEYPYRWVEALEGGGEEMEQVDARGVLFSVGYVEAEAGEQVEGVMSYERAVGRQRLLVSGGVVARVGVMFEKEGEV